MAWSGVAALIVAAANSCSETLFTSSAKSLSRAEKDLIVLLDKIFGEQSNGLFLVAPIVDSLSLTIRQQKKDHSKHLG
jgi:hypothetical protein